MDRGRILIVDDEPAICESLARWLERDGHEVENVLDGADALTAMNASRFDIVLVDVKMEGLSGLDLLRAIKSRHPDVAVIMITAYVSIASAISAMKSDACDYLIKPFDPNDLSLLVKETLEESKAARVQRPRAAAAAARRSPPAETRAEAGRKKPMKLMLVDDEIRLFSGAAKLLEKKGCDVITAASGDEALEKLRQSNVDVVVLDVKMPGMDGIETLSEIKRLFPAVEVILLTGHASVQSAVDGLKHGAIDFLRKPVDIEVLFRKAAEAFERRRGQPQKALPSEP